MSQLIVEWSDSIYGNGDDIAGTGDQIESGAFVLTAPEINSTAATNVTSNELLALIATGNTDNKVYNVTDTLLLRAERMMLKKLL